MLRKVFFCTLFSFAVNFIVYSKALDPNSRLYSLTFDLIDDTKGEAFKMQFDSLANVLYEYTVKKHKLYHEVIIPITLNSRTDTLYKTVFGRDISNPIILEEKVPLQYERRILEVLKVLYDFDMGIDPRFYDHGRLLDRWPSILLPLLAEYLNDAPDIDADWLYEMWVRIHAPSVMQERLPLYENEMEVLRNIAREKGYTNSIDGHALIVSIVEIADLKKYFPNSMWVKCVVEAYEKDTNDIRGILKQKNNK